MATPPVSDELVKQAVAARLQHGSNVAAAAALGYARTKIEHRLRLAVDRGFTTREAMNEATRKPPVPAPRLPQSADECWDVLDRAIGRYRDTPKPPPYKSTKFSDKRIVIAGDLHAPFHHVEAVGKMLADTHGFDQLIVNGDLQDSYSVSRFVKYEVVSWEREVAAVDALLGQFCARFPDVLIVDGNHDKPRFEKVLRTQLSVEVMAALEFITEGNFSSIRALVKRKGYGNARFAPIKVGRYNLSWAAQEGDLIVTHAERSSRVPSGVLRVVDEWLTDQHEALGLNPWRVLVQAHTHQLGMFPWRSDKLLVEGGALCGTMGYQLDAKVFGRGQRLGYVTLAQRDGVTDFASVRFHWLDPMLRAA
jgi:predicted phosphodiesterase